MSSKPQAVLAPNKDEAERFLKAIAGVKATHVSNLPGKGKVSKRGPQYCTARWMRYTTNWPS